MSDTPKTDAETKRTEWSGINPDFCRELEREITRLLEEIEVLRAWENKDCTAVDQQPACSPPSKDDQDVAALRQETNKQTHHGN